VYELEDEMPLSEVVEWRHFWALRAKEEKKAHEKAEREARARSGRRR
jgi:hypothetical protein